MGNEKPANAFEESLLKAANDPSHRSQFYKDFLASDVVVINPGGDLKVDEAGRTTENTTLEIQGMEFEGKNYIPIFSSEERLVEYTRPGTGYLALNTRIFLERTKGADLFLNPGSCFGKIFTASEVHSILNGSIWNQYTEVEVNKNTEYAIGRPAVFPKELVDTLGAVFKKIPEVRMANLALIHNPKEGIPPHTLIGIQASGDWNLILNKVVSSLDGVSIPNPPIDFIPLENESEMLKVLEKNGTVIYKKKLFGIFG